MKTLSALEIVNELFVPELHNKFRRDVENPKRFEDLMASIGGKIVIDHGATRTVDPEVHALITRIGKAMGLIVHGAYTFPEKHLSAVDLQAADSSGFKWFSTLIEYDKFSPEVVAAVEEDMARSKNVLSEAAMALLEKLESEGALTEAEGREFVDALVYGFLERQGEPVKRSTIDLVSEASSELTNALLMGPDFNHLAYLLNGLEIEGWFGLEVIEVLDAYLKENGFEMLPEIQGVAGGKLRQTSSMADNMDFDVEEADGSTGKINSPAKYLEFIQRGTDAEASKQFEGGKPVLFQGFLAKNTVKIYDSTNLD